MALKYATEILLSISAAQDEELISNVESDDELKAFLHAVANVVPTMIHNQFTGEDKNWLEMNHIANHLCFELSN